MYKTTMKHIKQLTYCIGGIIRVGGHRQHRTDIWVSERDMESSQFIS